MVTSSRRAMAPLTEFELIERFFRRDAPSAVLGVGDDAALLAPTPGCELAVSVDMLVAGRHFFTDVDPEALGHKTLAVNLSDMAAMGAVPRWALLAGALPNADPDWLDAFARGFFALATSYGVDLVGGDTTRGPLNLCVTIIGEAPVGSALRRSTAQAGDSIWVSGLLGDAALALAHRMGRLTLTSEEFTQCERALLRPTPRVELGIALRGIAHAAIDISDGLSGDLSHILDASALGAEVDVDAVPRSPALDRQLGGHRHDVALACLLAGGDDYELCFSAPVTSEDRIRTLSSELQVRLTRIGTLTASQGLVLRDGAKAPIADIPRGFDHFAA